MHFLVYLYYMQPFCRTSTFGQNYAYRIRIFTVFWTSLFAQYLYYLLVIIQYVNQFVTDLWCLTNYSIVHSWLVTEMWLSACDACRNLHILRLSKVSYYQITLAKLNCSVRKFTQRCWLIVTLLWKFWAISVQCTISIKLVSIIQFSE